MGILSAVIRRLRGRDGENERHGDAGARRTARSCLDDQSLSVSPPEAGESVPWSPVATSGVRSAPAFYALPWQVGRALSRRSGTRSTSLLPRHYSGWVYAAVRAISQGCSACEVRFALQRGGKRLGLPSEHPLARLFGEVNPFHTYRELVETTLTDLELTGNAFWVMSRRKISGVPAEIWPVPPAWMRVVPGRDDFVREYRLRRGGREVKLDARDVCHFRYPSPEDPWWGRAPLEAAIEAVQADESIARAQRRSFENGPLPGALLRTRDPLTKEQQERFRALFESGYVGPDAAGKLLITDGEAEITPFTTTPREMDFVDSARSVRDRILGVFGVPPAVLGIVEDFNRANAEAAQQIFARETLLPKLALLGERISQDVCSQFLPEGIRCEFASPVPADREADRRDMEAGMRLGALSANEARADFYGKPPVVSADGGEDYDRPKPVAGTKIDISREGARIGEKTDGEGS